MPKPEAEAEMRPAGVWAHALLSAGIHPEDACNHRPKPPHCDGAAAQPRARGCYSALPGPQCTHQHHDAGRTSAGLSQHASCEYLAAACKCNRRCESQASGTLSAICRVLGMRKLLVACKDNSVSVNFPLSCNCADDVCSAGAVEPPLPAAHSGCGAGQPGGRDKGPAEEAARTGAPFLLITLTSRVRLTVMRPRCSMHSFLNHCLHDRDALLT